VTRSGEDGVSSPAEALASMMLRDSPPLRASVPVGPVAGFRSYASRLGDAGL
jgi:hypothetical protein